MTVYKFMRERGMKNELWRKTGISRVRSVRHFHHPKSVHARKWTTEKGLLPHITNTLTHSLMDLIFNGQTIHIE